MTGLVAALTGRASFSQRVGRRTGLPALALAKDVNIYNDNDYQLQEMPMAVDVMTLLPSRPPLFALDLPDRLLLWAMREWLAAALARKPVTPALRKGLDSFGLGETASAVARYMDRSEEHTSELQQPMRTSYAVF